ELNVELRGIGRGHDHGQALRRSKSQLQSLRLRKGCTLLKRDAGAIGKRLVSLGMREHVTCQYANYDDKRHRQYGSDCPLRQTEGLVWIGDADPLSTKAQKVHEPDERGQSNQDE